MNERKIASLHEGVVGVLTGREPATLSAQHIEMPYSKAGKAAKITIDSEATEKRRNRGVVVGLVSHGHGLRLLFHGTSPCI